jgi:GGDEF domain-containing protein
MAAARAHDDPCAMPAAWSTELERLLAAELRDGAIDDPFRPAVLRWAASRKRRADHDGLLTRLEAARPGGRGHRRFRWRAPVGSWIPLEHRVRWRPAEAEQAERHAGEHADRLWLPPVMVGHLAWLAEVARDLDPIRAARAAALLDEALPGVEDIIAGAVAGTDPWADTFLLWSFVREPQALKPIRGLVTALAARYAARVGRTRGIVRGRTFPFFDQPLVSATAHLASASAALGEGIEWVDEQLAFLEAERRPDGGWGDAGQPSDILTTIAAAGLLGSIDPSFDPCSVLEPLRSMATASGQRPSLMGPEWPWITAELVRLARWAPRPFTERFRWPNVPQSAMDPRVGVPRFEGYLMLADLFRAVPALGRGRVDVAFIDLANFGKWNTTNGMQLGDDLLALLTAYLRKVPGSRTFRDGGDEFLVVAAPGTTNLEATLVEHCAGWPAVQRKALPGLAVVPLRAAIEEEPADDLRAARERLGVHIGEVKRRFKKPPEEGVVIRYGV